MHAFLGGVRKEKVECIRKLKADGYAIIALSNNNPISFPCCTQLFDDAGGDYFGMFDSSHLSYKIGFMKPAPEFFETFLSEIPYEPGELLFIDDSMQNVNAAIAAGIPSVHYETTTNPETASSVDLEALIRANLK